MEAPETQGKRTVFMILVSSCVFLCAESQNMQLYLTCSFQGNGRELKVRKTVLIEFTEKYEGMDLSDLDNIKEI